jgi:hypothetical protein
MNHISHPPKKYIKMGLQRAPTSTENTQQHFPQA